MKTRAQGPRPSSRAPPWSQAWGRGNQTPGFWVFDHRNRLGSRRKDNARPPSIGLTIHRKVNDKLVQCSLSNSHGRGPGWFNSQTVTLAVGAWNVPSLRGKEPEERREVERYPLERVELASFYIQELSSLRETGLDSTLAPDERRRAVICLDNVWIKILMSPTFCDSNYIYLVAILINIILIRITTLLSVVSGMYTQVVSSYTLYAHLEYWCLCLNADSESESESENP